MTREEIVEQLENAIGLIKQDGKDWLDDRDIPILEACIKSLTALDKIREEIINPNEMDKLENSNLWQKWFLNLIDKYKAESETV